MEKRELFRRTRASRMLIAVWAAGNLLMAAACEASPPPYWVAGCISFFCTSAYGNLSAHTECDLE